MPWVAKAATNSLLALAKVLPSSSTSNEVFWGGIGCGFGTKPLSLAYEAKAKYNCLITLSS